VWLLNIVIKWSHYRPDVAQRVGRGIALFFRDRGTRRGWVVSSTPRPHFNPGKGLVPILQEAGWAPGPVWTVEKSRPHRDSIPDRPASSQSLYRLSYPAHWFLNIFILMLVLYCDFLQCKTREFCGHVFNRRRIRTSAHAYVRADTNTHTHTHTHTNISTQNIPWHLNDWRSIVLLHWRWS